VNSVAALFNYGSYFYTKTIFLETETVNYLNFGTHVISLDQHPMENISRKIIFSPVMSKILIGAPLMLFQTLA
jgi:hypothetical protein